MPARINLSVKRSGIRLLLGVMLLSSTITGFAAEAPVLRFRPSRISTRRGCRIASAWSRTI